MVNYLHDVQLSQQGLNHAASTMLQLGQMLDRKQERLDYKAERDEERRKAEMRRLKAEEERQAAIQDRTDEREAEYAVMLGVDHIKSGWNGADTVDADGKTVHTPGVVDLTWQQMRDGDTDPVKEMERLKKEVYASDYYQRLSAAQKEKFERKFIFKKSEFARAASLQHGKLTIKRNKDETDAMIAWNGDRVSEVYGGSDEDYGKTARWAVSQNFKHAMGTAVENPEIFDDPSIDFTKPEEFAKINWRGKPSDDELALRRKALVDMAVEYDRGRIKALADAAAGNHCFDGNPDLNTPEKCLAKAAILTNGLNGNYYGLDDKGKKINPGPELITDTERNELLGYLEKSGLALERARIVQQTKNAKELNEGFRKDFLDGTEDTTVLLAKKFDKSEYGQRINGLLATRQIDEKCAVALTSQYNQLADRQEYVRRCVDIYKRTGKGGVWTRVKNRDGKEIEVFQPDRLGNGKAETDPAYAAKYTKVDRSGNVPYFNNPAAGMEELDYDLRMGNISVPFYNAQMGKMRVFSDARAKSAFVKVFGANPTIFSEKDISEMERGGATVAHRDIWAKNKWWAGNHDIGSRKNVPWHEDATVGDGGEEKVSLEQEAQIYEIVRSLSAEGIDPTDAIRAYLAPTFEGWLKSDLSERLDPMRKVGGKTFIETILSSNRYGNANAPSEREKRIQARQKEAYGDIDSQKAKK